MGLASTRHRQGEGTPLNPIRSSLSGWESEMVESITVLVIRPFTTLRPFTLPIPGYLCSSQSIAQKAHHMIGACFISLSMYLRLTMVSWKLIQI